MISALRSFRNSGPAAISAFIAAAFMSHSFAANTHAASSSGFLLTANKGSHSMGIINADGREQIAELPEGGVTGHELAATLDGRLAFVPIYGDSGVGKPGTDGDKVAVFDLDSRKLKGYVEFGHGVRPHCAVAGPKDGMIYVTTELDQSVSIIDPSSLKVVGSVPTGAPESHMLAISPDGNFGYTANVGAGSVSVLDLKARKLSSVVPVSKSVQRISVSPDGKYVFTADQTQSRLAVIDADSKKLKTYIPLPSIGFGTTPSRDGKWLFATLISKNQVAVIDLNTMQVTRTLPMPSSPQEVLVRPDNKVAYVSCDNSNGVVPIDLSTWKVGELIKSGKVTDGLAWAPAI